ncbi:MAG: T9SS type A sorting domain-containing protein, partial [Flavobacteriales bacterium]|nr:T9SS type A sorting domain-containing protein [Flavobacteriales bacterium]
LVYPFCDCDFNGGAYGAYLYRGWADVQDNNFHMGAYEYDYGLVCNDLGKYSHIVYNNDFSENRIGLYIWNRNRNAGGSQGLVYECNDFFQNVQDVVIWNPNYPGSLGAGIRELQGEADPLDINFHLSATNTYQSGGGFSYDDIESTVTNYHIYRYAIGELDPAEVYDIPDGNVNWELEQLDAQNTLPCESIFELVNGEGQRNAATTLVISKQAELSAITDGGNTQELTEEVVMTEYSSALETFYELMTHSPSLSEEVMIEAIKKEYDLPAALLTLILKSNPRAARSTAIRNELDNRVMPLSEYQREQINEALELLGTKELLEFQMQSLLGERDEAIRVLTHQALFDSTLADKIPILLGLFDPELILSDRISKVQILMAARDYETAGQLLDSASDVFKLSEEDEVEIAELSTLIDLKLIDPELSSSTSANQLEELVELGQPTSAAMALGWLCELAEYTFEEPLYLPSTPVEMRAITSTIGQPTVWLQPNPPVEWTVVNSMLPFDQISVYNAVGQVVDWVHLSSPSSSVLLNVLHLPAGVYSVAVSSQDGSFVGQTSMVK